MSTAPEEALERAYGYPARTDWDVRERAAVLALLRDGKPTGPPRELDARLRAELAEAEWQ